MRAWSIGLIRIRRGAFPCGSQCPRPSSAQNPLAGHLTSRYVTEVAERENNGTNLAGEQSELSPLPPSAFTAPENEYRVYAQRWIVNAIMGAASLQHALATGRRTAAMMAWESTWSDYLHLGAVYGLFSELSKEIDGNPGGLPGGASDARFTGLHRIEMGLWRLSHKGWGFCPLGLRGFWYAPELLDV